jgi:hypothetical protein
MKRCPECRRDYYDDTLLYCLDDDNALLEGRELFLDGSKRRVWFLGLLVIFAAYQVWPQQKPQAPSPMGDSVRPHPRIAQTEEPGRRVELKTLKGARIFAGPKVNTKRAVPLIVHFHGVTWLVESHTAKHAANAVLITVNLGTGSSAYGRPFENPELFQALIDEASQALELKNGWSTITLSGFSAGYGGVRAILRQEKNFALVNNVLLLDGMHASYSPEGKPLAEGGAVNATDLDSFIKFAREAVAGRKTFVFTHSEIFPGTYVSTTESADYVLAALNLRSKPALKEGPLGMQQLGTASAGRLHVFAYAGNTAPDHVDHLQAMPYWLKWFRFK